MTTSQDAKNYNIFFLVCAVLTILSNVCVCHYPSQNTKAIFWRKWLSLKQTNLAH